MSLLSVRAETAPMLEPAGSGGVAGRPLDSLNPSVSSLASSSAPFFEIREAAEPAEPAAELGQVLPTASVTALCVLFVIQAATLLAYSRMVFGCVCKPEAKEGQPSEE